MATAPIYCTHKELKRVYPQIDAFDAKTPIYGFTKELDDWGSASGLDLYYSWNTGLVNQLFIDGVEATKIELPTSAHATSTVGTTSENADAILVTADPTSTFAAGDILKFGDYYAKVSAVTAGGTPNIAISDGSGNGNTMFGTKSVSVSASRPIYLALDATGTNAPTGSIFLYDSDLDLLALTVDSNQDPNDLIIESGQDNATYFDQMLVNASMELNSLLDKRFPMPLPKFAQFDLNTSYTSSSVEYDAIIIKSTCYIVASNLMRQSSRGDEADYYYNLVVNPDGTGIVDRLNRGESKLAFETDHQKSKGKVREVTKSGTMSLIETGGAYVGELFELFEIECTTGGAYGTAKVSVKSYGSDKLLGTTKTAITITGGLQHIAGGWYARWQGASMTSGDKWEVELYSDDKKITNLGFGSVELNR